MFIIEKVEAPFVDAVADANAWVKRDSMYADRFDAIKDLKDIDRQMGGKLTGRNGWKRVASVIGPVLEVARALDDNLLRDKKKFYSWLDRNPQYCTYDRRRGRSK